MATLERLLFFWTEKHVGTQVRTQGGERLFPPFSFPGKAPPGTGVSGLSVKFQRVNLLSSVGWRPPL